jgi:hypothetical protein
MFLPRINETLSGTAFSNRFGDMMTKMMIGISNYLPKTDKYLLFIDMDDVSKKEASDEMFKYGCDAILLRTRPRHYWIVGLNPLSKSEWLVKYFDSKDDYHHFGFSKRWGKTVLRMTQKYKGDTIALEEVCVVNKTISRAHLAFFREFFGDSLIVFHDNRQQNCGIQLVKYEDLKRKIEVG